MIGFFARDFKAKPRCFPAETRNPVAAMVAPDLHKPRALNISAENNETLRLSEPTCERTLAKQ